MDQPASIAPESAPLHSLGGGAPPPGLGADLRRILDLPEAAQQHLWEVLAPSLAAPVSDEVEARFAAFCQHHEIPADVFERVIKASRFLLRAAASIDLGRALFTDDLRRLVGESDAPRVQRVLLAGYDLAKAHVRRGLVRRTLAEHGKVVEGVDWRIERLIASNHGDHFDVPMTSVTLHYREGEQRGQITVYLDPDAMDELGRAHARLRSAAAREP
jgi:hypothetical protein